MSEQEQPGNGPVSDHEFSQPMSLDEAREFLRQYAAGSGEDPNATIYMPVPRASRTPRLRRLEPRPDPPNHDVLPASGAAVRVCVESTFGAPFDDVDGCEYWVLNPPVVEFLPEDRDISPEFLEGASDWEGAGFTMVCPLLLRTRRGRYLLSGHTGGWYGDDHPLEYGLQAWNQRGPNYKEVTPRLALDTLVSYAYGNDLPEDMERLYRDLDEAAGVKRTAAPRATAERDRWIYRQARAGVAWDKILAEAKARGWPLGSSTAARKAANVQARLDGLPELEPRRRGRPKSN